jgi:hypothetical protein
LIKKYLEARIHIPINETRGNYVNEKVDWIVNDLQQFLSINNGIIIDQEVFEKEIVYTSSRNEDFTKEEILSFIENWMTTKEPFASFSGQLYEFAKDDIYELLINNFDGKHPNQALQFFDEDEKMTIMQRLNVRIEKLMGLTLTEY